MRFAAEVVSVVRRHFCHGIAKNKPPPKLSQQQITSVLRANEKTFETCGSVLKSIDWNQLASNNPCEDALAVAQLVDKKSYLLSVLDGHGGSSCARVLSKRLLSYVSACLPWEPQTGRFLHQLTPYLPELHPEACELYAHMLRQFCSSVSHLRDQLRDNDDIETVSAALLTAYETLDQQLSEEALAFVIGAEMSDVLAKAPRWDWQPWLANSSERRKSLLHTATFSAAMSGAVVCTAHVSQGSVVVANTGDCQAVIGFLGEDGNWWPRKLSHEHTADNPSETARLYSSHPRSEQDTILRSDRLLGQLMPLRAFGDFRFKWPRNVIEKYVVPLTSPSALPMHYKTPPYLTARPEITHTAIGPRDKFLIIASDGLWDMLSPTQVVRLVGEHMSGRVALGPLTLPPGDVTLNGVNELLRERKLGLSRRPLDTNAATHLIRHALGGSDTGLDLHKLAELLTLPVDVVRLFRDDISIVVAYFDTDSACTQRPFA